MSGSDSGAIRQLAALCPTPVDTAYEVPPGRPNVSHPRPTRLTWRAQEGLPVPFRFESLELASARSSKQRGHTATEKRDDAGPNGDERMVLPENIGLRRSARGLANDSAENCATTKVEDNKQDKPQDASHDSTPADSIYRDPR